MKLKGVHVIKTTATHTEVEDALVLMFLQVLVQVVLGIKWLLTNQACVLRVGMDVHMANEDITLLEAAVTNGTFVWSIRSMDFDVLFVCSLV